MVLGLTVYGAHEAPQPGAWAAVQLWASESHSVPQGNAPLAAGLVRAVRHVGTTT